MKQRLLSIFAILSLMISGAMAQKLTVDEFYTEGWDEWVHVNIEDATEMTALQFNLSLPEGFTLGEKYILRGNVAPGFLMNATVLESGDLFVVYYNFTQDTFRHNGLVLHFPVSVAEDAVTGEARIYNVRAATADAVSYTLSDVTFAMNIEREEPEPTWHLSGPATEEEVTTQSYIDGLVYNQTDKPSTITLKKGYNVIIIPSSWTTPTFGLVSDFSKRYTPFTANDLGITNPSNKNVLVLWSEVENATCYVKWGTNVVPEPEPEPETKYYWYAGTTDPTTMTSIDPIIPADAASYVYGWTEITEAPTEIRVFKESSNWQETGLFPEVQWYIAFPAEFSLGMVGGGWTKSQTVINGVLYDIWTCGTLVDTANSQFIKLETPDYTPDPETKCYWYVGTTDPRTMTNIDPIIPADAASYVYGWTEITETPTMIDVFKESSNWEETGLFPDVQWYIACPSAYGFNTTSYLIPVGGWYVIRNAVTIGGIEYDVWKSQTLTSAVATLLAKVGEPVSKPEPEPEPEPEATPITSIEELNNVTLYYISLPNHTNGLVSWAAAENGLKMKSCADLGVAPDANDTKQQFAFISNDGGATRYLYHAAEKKFVAKDGSLCEYPHDALSFVAGAYEGTFVAHFDDSHYINVGGSSQMAVDSWTTADGGNSAVILPVGEYDPAEALAAFEKELPTVTGITSIDELSNEKLYYVSLPNHTNGLVSWAVNGEALKSSKDLGAISCPGDLRQQFAFINYEGVYYLYHAASKMFVGANGTLSDTPANTVSFSAGNADGTFVVCFDNGHYINVGGSNQMIIDGWNTPDGGNSCVIAPVADFDPAEAIEAIKTTGIESSVLEAQGSQLIYDLMGRRVEKAEKGIYIVNGKKVIVK